MSDLVDFWLLVLVAGVTVFGYNLGKILELNKQLGGNKMERTLDRIFALKITPSGETEVIDMTNKEVGVLQEAVGGWIEGIALAENVMMWCNEDGHQLKMLRNPFAEMIWDAYIDRKNPIVGTVVLTGGVDEKGDLFSLTHEQIDRVVNDITFIQVVQPLKGRYLDDFGIS